MNERIYWLGFSVFPGIGPKRFAQLVSYFTSVKTAWYADKSELKNAGLGDITSERFLAFRKTFVIENYVLELEEKRVAFTILTDEKYPTLLKQIDNPPFVLYIRGTIDFDSVRTIGIVGTRKITSYGREATELLTRDLVHNGFCVVSGLALGVDAVAHTTTIESKGVTIGVLGCGADVCYPTANQHIYDEITSGNGAVVSEYPLGVTPSIGSFPSRNRIIAGLSEAVIVTEGAADSGALITAEDAFKNNRPVFAVPGQITSSLAKGPLSLLQKGAKLVTDVEIILSGLQATNNITSKKKTQIKGDTEEEQIIVDLLQNEPHNFDQLVRKTGLSSSALSTVLSLMEMKGFITTDTVSNYKLDTALIS